MTAPHPYIPVVLRHYRMPQATLLGRSQKWEARHARAIAMYLLHTQGRQSYTQIGRMFDRYPQTVADAVIAIEEMRDDPKFDAHLSRLENELPKEAINPFLTFARASYSG